MFLSEWRQFPSAPCLAGKEAWWQLASRCCWNRARPWHVSEIVSFLVGLRTYQNVGILCPETFFPPRKSFRLWDNVKKCGGAKQATGIKQIWHPICVAAKQRATSNSTFIEPRRDSKAFPAPNSPNSQRLTGIALKSHMLSHAHTNEVINVKTADRNSFTSRSKLWLSLCRLWWDLKSYEFLWTSPDVNILTNRST
jgi:hypothetical protein